MDGLNQKAQNVQHSDTLPSSRNQGRSKGQVRSIKRLYSALGYLDESRV